MTGTPTSPSIADNAPADNSTTAEQKAAIELISGFFTRVGAKIECPICDAKHWEIVSQNAIILTHDGSGNRWSPKYEIPSLALACKNCGFLRLHSTAIMTRMAEELLNPAGGGT